MTLGNSHIVPVPLHPSKAKVDVCVISSASASCCWCPRCNSKQLSMLSPYDGFPSLGQPVPLKVSEAASFQTWRMQAMHATHCATISVCNQCTLGL